MQWHTPSRYLWLILSVATLLLLWKIHLRGINEWDEARNGVNAYEMYHNHDFINLYYDGAPDTWNAKPPLMIWMITGCYWLFGFNSFALRLPSVFAALGFFIYTWKLFRMRGEILTTIITCLILLSSKAVISNHIGLTGDFDALLLFFLVASAYYFFSYFENQNKNAIYWCALCTCLAFYTKGPAAFIYIPSFFIYATLRQRSLSWIKDYRVWLSVLIVAIIACSWVVLVLAYGKSSIEGHYGNGNALKTMVVYDTWERLSSNHFDGGQLPDHLFFFEVIDVRLNLWNYLFYLALLMGIISLIRKRDKMIRYLDSSPARMPLFALCAILPLSIILTFAASKHDWYLAPTFPFIAYITAFGIVSLGNRWKGAYIITGLLFLFALGRHWSQIDCQESNLSEILSTRNHLFTESNQFITTGPIRQDILLYLKWMNKTFIHVQAGDVPKYQNSILVLNASDSYAYPLMDTLNAGGYSFGIIK